MCIASMLVLRGLSLPLPTATEEREPGESVLDGNYTRFFEFVTSQTFCPRYIQHHQGSFADRKWYQGEKYDGTSAEDGPECSQHDRLVLKKCGTSDHERVMAHWNRLLKDHLVGACFNGVLAKLHAYWEGMEAAGRECSNQFLPPGTSILLSEDSQVFKHAFHLQVSGYTKYMILGSKNLLCAYVAPSTAMEPVTIVDNTFSGGTTVPLTNLGSNTAAQPRMPWTTPLFLPATGKSEYPLTLTKTVDNMWSYNIKTTPVYEKTILPTIVPEGLTEDGPQRSYGNSSHPDLHYESPSKNVVVPTIPVPVSPDHGILHVDDNLAESTLATRTSNAAATGIPPDIYTPSRTASPAEVGEYLQEGVSIGEPSASPTFNPRKAQEEEYPIYYGEAFEHVDSSRNETIVRRPEGSLSANQQIPLPTEGASSSHKEPQEPEMSTEWYSPTSSPPKIKESTTPEFRDGSKSTLGAQEPDVKQSGMSDPNDHAHDISESNGAQSGQGRGPSDHPRYRTNEDRVDSTNPIYPSHQDAPTVPATSPAGSKISNADSTSNEEYNHYAMGTSKPVDAFQGRHENEQSPVKSDDNRLGSQYHAHPQEIEPSMQTHRAENEKSAASHNPVPHNPAVKESELPSPVSIIATPTFLISSSDPTALQSVGHSSENEPTVTREAAPEEETALTISVEGTPQESATESTDDPSLLGKPNSAMGPDESSVPLDPASTCFPGQSRVLLMDGSLRRMSDLAVTDRVHVGRGEFSDVYLFSHADPNVMFTFVRLDTSDGALILTPNHYVYADGILMAARDVTVGSRLERANGTSSVVVAIGSERHRGLYNPHTLHGDIAVDGFITSTFTTSVEPRLASALLAPMRTLYQAGLSKRMLILPHGCDWLAQWAPSGPSKIVLARIL